MAKFHSFPFLDGWVKFIEIRIQNTRGLKYESKTKSTQQTLQSDIKNRTRNELCSNTTTVKTTQNRNGSTTPDTTS